MPTATALESIPGTPAFAQRLARARSLAAAAKDVSGEISETFLSAQANVSALETAADDHFAAARATDQFGRRH